MEIKYDMVKNNDNINAYIKNADECLESIGYTEHSFAHVGIVTKTAAKILREFGYTEKEVELVKVAAYMHDIGNVINRSDHAQTGAIMAFRILSDMGIDADDISKVCCAIGNHDEGTGLPVNAITAALILADKCDVRRNRIRKEMLINGSKIHYNVNYSVSNSKVMIDAEKRTITLELIIDTSICSVMDYFEIFLTRMKLCKLAAKRLNANFVLIINNQVHS